MLMFEKMITDYRCEKMVENEKGNGFADIIITGLNYVSQFISASIVPPITEGAELIMKNIDDRVLQIENRILGKIISLLIIGFGGVFLVLALFFFMKEYLAWNNTSSFFTIGITVFVIGLLLKLRESNN